MKQYKRKRYTNLVNLSGIGSKAPVLCSYSKFYSGWWSKDGNLDAPTLGLVDKQSYITFTSENKKDVELWTKGAKSVLKMLRRWSS
jgi:hypothetical protein